MFLRPVMVSIAAAVLTAAMPAFSQEAPKQAGGGAQQAAPRLENDPRAVEFLRGVEARNAATTSLRGRFEQSRVDRNFLDEVKSRGEFYYSAPGRFRANYEGKERGVVASSIYMVNDRLWHYVPENKQVDVTDLPKGDSAAVNQMLLGFGVKTEKILEYFRVSMAKGDPPAGRTVLEFESLDRSRTLNFERVTIVFLTEKRTPELLRMEDSDSETTIRLVDVAINPTIDEAVFEPKFPSDVEIIERSGQGVLSVRENP